MGELEPGGYKIPEAATILNCHPNTVKNMIRDKQLATYRVGRLGKRGTVRVTKESVERRLAGEKVRK